MKKRNDFSGVSSEERTLPKKVKKKKSVRAQYFEKLEDQQTKKNLNGYLDDAEDNFWL